MLWRHAPTASNLGGVVQGTLDVGLDDFGLRRARWAADCLVSSVIPRGLEGPAPVRIYSSPLQRAVQTAQALAEIVDADVVIDDAFRQRSYGVWEGLSWEQVRRDWPDEFARREAGLDPDIAG